MKLRIGCVIVGLLLVLSLGQLTSAQAPAQPASTLPHLVRFAGTVKDVNGNPLTGLVGVTFALYSEQTGGTALWLETQNVTTDSGGRYAVLLGSTKATGLPEDLFTSEQAHWVGVEASGQAEQPRVLLVSAPYALKAGDAETIGGLPPSAFVLAAPLSNAANNGTNAGAGVNAGTTAAVGGSGTADFVPLWTAGSILGNSVLFQSGSGSTATVGINTTTPAATLDVNGNVISRGALQLPSIGTATAGGGFNSQPFDSVTSVYNSTAGSAQNQDFRWLAEPVGNNTSSPSGKLDLLFGANGATPTETGLSVANNGIITFAAGQTFGGGGGGTITGVTAGTDLTGGGTSGTVTLNLDITKVPQLGAANTFAANQTVNGTLTSNTSNPFGLIGTTSSTATLAAGVEGGASATTGATIGVYGYSQSSGGFGVYGEAFSLTGLTYGVYGQTESPAGYGVKGTVDAGTGSTAGVFGQAQSSTGYGVEGINDALSGNAVGVYGSAAISPTGYGVEGQSAFVGVYGTGPVGVLGIPNSNTASGTSGVEGQTSSPNTSSGVFGNALAQTGNSAGVLGNAASPAGYGVQGSNSATSGTAPGVYGTTNSSAGYGVLGTGPGTGVYGTSTGSGYGVEGVGQNAGVFGESLASSGQTFGIGGFASSPGGYGVWGVDVAPSGGVAGFFNVSSSSATILQGTNSGTVEFNVDAAGDVSGNSFQIAGQLFAFGNNNLENAFLGFAGSPGTNSKVSFDTAVGYTALVQDAGQANTAVGVQALLYNTTGANNTAIGAAAGTTLDSSNLTNSGNTALGAFARFGTGTLNNATAIGYDAYVSESNALVLGSGANVGIGTSAPGHLLDVAGVVAVDSLGQNNGTGIDLTFGLNAGEGISSSRTAAPNQYGIDLWTDFARRISIEQHGNVGIGTTSPDNLLTVNGSADKPGGGSWGTFSDARLKTVNGGFTDGLSQVMKIQPIHYRYKPGNAMDIRDMDEHIGVVAQDIQKVIPEAVTQNSKGYLLVNNDPIIWTMLNAIKEQQREIKQQQSLLRAQSAAMKNLRAEVRETRESLRKVKAQVAAAQPGLVAAK